MKYLVATALLAGVLISAAHAESPACKRQAAERDAPADCKKPPGKARATGHDGGLSAADKEALDRAHTRTLLENIDAQLRRQRLGN